MKKERDKAKQEVKVARLAAIAAGEAKARAGDGVAMMRDALVATEEDGRGLEAEVARLTVERTSLLLKLETSRDEVLTLHSHVGKTRKPWWKTTRKPWSKFSLMATDTVCSNMASAMTDQGFWMACLTLSTHFL